MMMMVVEEVVVMVMVMVLSRFERGFDIAPATIASRHGVTFVCTW